MLSVDRLDTKSEREKPRSVRLLTGKASEKATLRCGGREGVVLAAVSSWVGGDPEVGSVDRKVFEMWLSSDDAGVSAAGEGSSMGTSGKLCTLRRSEPRLHHCTKPPGGSASMSRETTGMCGDPSLDGEGEMDLVWKKCLTLSTIERARLGRYSGFQQSVGRMCPDVCVCGGIGSGIVRSMGLGNVEPGLEDDVDEHWVSGDGASADPPGLCTTAASPSTYDDWDGTTDNGSLPRRFATPDLDRDLLDNRTGSGLCPSSGSPRMSDAPSSEPFRREDKTIVLSWRRLVVNAPDMLSPEFERDILADFRRSWNNSSSRNWACERIVTNVSENTSCRP